jgi:isopentenyl-diphosphate delta-isomerase
MTDKNYNVITVDENDNQISVVPRSEHDEHIYRVSALSITNSKGEILLAQRAFTKKHHPGKWGPAVAGTVEEGETYLSNILKETEEEIGISITEEDIELGPKTDTLDKKYKHFTQWFYYRTDKDITEFTYSDDEVADIRWFTPEEIRNNVGECLESLIHYLDILSNNN